MSVCRGASGQVSKDFVSVSSAVLAPCVASVSSKVLHLWEGVEFKPKGGEFISRHGGLLESSLCKSSALINPSFVFAHKAISIPKKKNSD